MVAGDKQTRQCLWSSLPANRIATRTSSPAPSPVVPTGGPTQSQISVIFSIKSSMLNPPSNCFLFEDNSADMISATAVFYSDSASLRGSKIMLSKTALPRLNQMLAAITRMNEDSCRKIPTRCRGQSTRDLNQISTWSTWKDQRWSIDGIRLVWETYARDRKAHSHAFAMGKKRNPVRGGAR